MSDSLFPGITNRPEKADPVDLKTLKFEFDRLRKEIEAAKPDALFVVSAEHYANFFNNNMPT